MAAGLTAWVAALDEAPALNRLRRLVHAAGRRVAFAVDCACIAACVLGLLTFSLAGFELPTAARLWGGFWTHYADAPPAAREPVLSFMMAVWLIATVLVGFCRFPRKQAVLSGTERKADDDRA